MIYIHAYSKLMKNKFEQQLWTAIMINFADIIADDGYMDAVCKRIDAEMARLADLYPNGKDYEISKYQSAQQYVTMFGTDTCDNDCLFISKRGSSTALIQVVSTRIMSDDRTPKGGAR